MAAHFVPTDAEITLTNAIFAQADPNDLSVLTGDVAARTFSGANVSLPVLGEIWNIADEGKKGWLSKREVHIAVRLMGHAQAGTTVAKSLIGRPGPLPSIEGIEAIPPNRMSGNVLTEFPSPPPVLNSQDRAKFQSIFDAGEPINGLLSGDKARAIFMKSRLPVVTLLQIWDLADTQVRGALDSTDFVIGMYLIQHTMNGSLPSIPSSLPLGLYEQAGGNPQTSSGIATSSIPARIPTLPHSSDLRRPRANTVGHTSRSSVRPSRAATIAITPSRPPGDVAWDVTFEEKAVADGLFDTLDPDRKGYITGDVAVPFMLDSKLDVQTLAKIWDLCDIRSDGKLTQDGFALAIHLINGKLAGTDIPTVLPPALVPPSMRTQGSTIGSVSAFVPPPEPRADFVRKGVSPATHTAMQPPIASFREQPTNGVHSVPSPERQTDENPFTSFFDPSQFQAFEILLEATHDHRANSPSLEGRSAEIGDATNQFHTSLDAAKIQRESIEQTLARQVSQLSALQTQLASAKAAYEVKMRRLSALKERLIVQTAHLESAQEHLIRVEGDMGCTDFPETPSVGDGAGDSARDRPVPVRSQPTINGNGVHDHRDQLLEHQGAEDGEQLSIDRSSNEEGQVQDNEGEPEERRTRRAEAEGNEQGAQPPAYEEDLPPYVELMEVGEQHGEAAGTEARLQQ